MNSRIKTVALAAYGKDFNAQLDIANIEFYKWLFSTLDKKFMSIAIDLAKESFDSEEVPVGAVVVKEKKF